MTVNACVNVSNNWVNISTAAGLAVGVNFIAQLESSGVILKNSATEPTDKEGGLETQKDLRVIACEPESGEYVWGIAKNGNVLVRIQA